PVSFEWSGCRADSRPCDGIADLFICRETRRVHVSRRLAVNHPIGRVLMKIADLFETRVEEKIEPVIKVGERGDEHKLASEIGSYVVTPMIESYLDDMLEHYTDTFLNKTTEIGIWISGYFGSGKSHFAKILSLLAGNPILEG